MSVNTPTKGLYRSYIDIFISKSKGYEAHEDTNNMGHGM